MALLRDACSTRCQRFSVRTDVCPGSLAALQAVGARMRLFLRALAQGEKTRFDELLERLAGLEERLAGIDWAY